MSLRIYPGADATFTLYEDDGLTYAYEKGAYSTIGLHWNDAERCLSIDARKGSYPGMAERRSFRVVVADPEHPVPLDTDAPGGTVVTYDGSATEVRF